MKHITILITALFLAQFSTAQTDTLLVKNHLTKITKTNGYRNSDNPELLNEIADYIYNDFKKYSDTVYFQEFQVAGITYKNVICSFGSTDKKTIILGAHYDVCGDQQGADDNASGIVGLLELARQFKGQKPNYRLELVAYTLEEPPYFRTENMGSYIHAKSLKDNDTEVFGMVSLEMIGFFKDEKKSQEYPVGILSLIYGNKGNYITLVNKFGKGKFARQFSRNYKKAHTVRAKKFTAPKIMEGIDYSDHLNYWKFNYSALMLTDTSFFRNPHYHKNTDTMETLDIPRMAKVIDGVYRAVMAL
jgi:peptidase M28-like protein